MQYTALQVDYFEHVYNHCLVFIFNRAGCSLDRPVYFCEQGTFPRLQNFFHKLDTSRFCFFIHGGQICRLGSFTNASDPLICFLTSGAILLRLFNLLCHLCYLYQVHYCNISSMNMFFVNFEIHRMEAMSFFLQEQWHPTYQ